MSKFVFETEDEVIKAAYSFMESRVIYETEPLSSPKLMADMFRLRLGVEESEVFSVALMCSQNRLIKVVDVFFGTIDGAAVYPRVVAQLVLKHNAASVALSHNHPSGSLEPSYADKKITARLKDALALIDVRILDHIIVSREGSYSFAEHGLM